METDIINVKYADVYEPKAFSGKAYSYYTSIKLNVGDLVLAPTAYGNKIAKVSEINVPEYKIANYKHLLRQIIHKID